MKLTNDQIFAKVQQDIQQAENFYKSYIEPNVLERYQLYNADKDYYEKKFKKLSKRSSIVSRDIYAAVEWALPSLMRIFFGSEEVVSIKGRTVEDDRQAEIMQKLINYQIQRKNDGFMVFERWFKDALITGLGILKCYWDRDVQEEEFENYFSLEGARVLETDPLIEIISSEISEDKNYYRVHYKVRRITKNQPVLENIHSSEFIYNPNAKTIKDSPFVAHRKLVTADYLKRKAEEGWYDRKAVEKAIKAANSEGYTDDSVEQYLRPYRNDFQQYPDEARKQILLYECYTRLDVNGDGLLESVIITVANNQILRIVENIYKRPPFFIITPLVEPYQIWGKGFADILADTQHLKTAVMRQLLIGIGLNNDPKTFINEDLVNIDDLLNDAAFIRVNGNPSQAISPYPHKPLDPWNFNFLEYMEVDKENILGITRYSQGLDSKSLNKRIDINTPVPMADGTWKLLGDIQDGDVIIGGDGKPTKVIKAHEICMSEKAYELEFSNGAKIIADAEHLWGVFVYRHYHVLNTDNLKELFDNGKPLYIPRPQKILSGEERDLPIDPYVFGAWLGDGHKYSSRFTIADDEIFERIKEWCKKQGWEIKEDKHQNSGKAKTYLITSCRSRGRNKKGQFTSEDSFHKRLSSLDVYPRTGGEPHIPNIYFRASYSQRLELLRGLMDTDGCWGSNGIAIFCTSNRRLAEDVAKLVRSLGGNPHIRRSRKAGKDICNGQVCNVKEHWHVNFNIADCPFYLSRKANSWKPPKKQKTYRIVNIKQVENRLMRCLTVDNKDGLWLVGEQYITTHNTATGINLIMQASSQRLELIARRFAETGIKDLFNFLVELNQRFIDHETVIRLTNEDFVVRPDDIKGEFDLIVNAGIGVGEKETTLQNLQNLLAIFPQLIQLGIVTPKNIYNVMKKYIETLGFKNVDDFITNPEQQQFGGINGGTAAAGIPAEQAIAALQGGLQGTPGGVQETDIQGMAGSGQGEVGGIEG